MAAYYNNLNELADAVYNAYNAGIFTGVYSFVLDGKFGVYNLDDKENAYDGCDYEVGLGSQFDSLYDHLVKEGIEMDAERYWGDEAEEADVNEMKAAIYKGLAHYLNVDAE
jgi:hypothetical protein